MPFGTLTGSNYAHQGIFVALGANTSYGASGPLENLQNAIIRLRDTGIGIERASRPWHTPAWPDPNDPPFVNACIEISTQIGPDALMSRLHEIEQELGRQRTIRNAPRSLDLDLIDYQGAVLDPGQECGLALPHPRAVGRAFVLLPLRDIAPEWRDPVSGLSLDQLITQLPETDISECRPINGQLCAAVDGLKHGAG